MGTALSTMPADSALTCCESREAAGGCAPERCGGESDTVNRLLSSTSSRASFGSHHLPAHTGGETTLGGERVSLKAELTAVGELVQRVQHEISGFEKEISRLKRLTTAIKEELAVARAKFAARTKELQEETMLHDSIIAKLTRDMRVPTRESQQKRRNGDRRELPVPSGARRAGARRTTPRSPRPQGHILTVHDDLQRISSTSM